MIKAEQVYRDEDFYKLFSKIYREMTQTGKAPWLQDGVPERGIAYNPKSGVIFRGVNSILLEMRAAQKGYKDSRWISMYEVDKLGIKVKTNEVPTPVAYVNKYAPPTNVNPVTGKIFDQRNPRQKYYFMYNVEQLIGCELTHDRDFIISNSITTQKIKNVIKNTKTNNIGQINHIVIQKTIQQVSKEMESLSAAVSQYRLAQEFHIPYKNPLSSDSVQVLTNQTNTASDTLLRTLYQTEIVKDRLLKVDQQLESDITRTVDKTKTKQQTAGFDLD